MFNDNERVDTLWPPMIYRIISMWVYTDIIELSAVGNIQAQFLEYVPIQRKFDKIGYWKFNSRYYIEVIEHSLCNKIIKICTDKKENFPIVDGKLTCSLHCCRRPILV